MPGKREICYEHLDSIRATHRVLSSILLVGFGATAQTVTTIHDFGERGDGENPQAGVVFDQAGNLYGTTALGAGRKRDVYSLTPPDGGPCPGPNLCYTSFEGQPDGAVPVCSWSFSREIVWHD